MGGMVNGAFHNATNVVGYFDQYRYFGNTNAVVSVSCGKAFC
jgi:hypothetical protein